MSFDPYNYRISGTLRAMCPSSLSDVYELTEILNFHEQSGLIFQKLWNQQPSNYNIYDTGGELRLSRLIVLTKFGEFVPRESIKQYEDPSGGIWVRLGQNERTEQFELSKGVTVAGIQNTKVSNQTIVENYVFVRPVFFNPIISTPQTVTPVG